MKTEPNKQIAGMTSIQEIVGNPRYPKEVARHEVKGGLTKREHFAGLAMQGYCGGEYIGQSGMPHNQIAEWSVKMADALIEQLNRNI